MESWLYTIDLACLELKRAQNMSYERTWSHSTSRVILQVFSAEANEFMSSLPYEQPLANTLQLQVDKNHGRNSDKLGQHKFSI